MNELLDAPSGATPRELGFRMPAEWSLQASMWLAWPHNPDIWDQDFEPIERNFAQLVAEISKGQRVDLLVPDADIGRHALSRVAEEDGRRDHLVLHQIPTNDVWMRDNGPTFLTRNDSGRKELALVDWRHNGWGEKYAPWDADDAVPLHIASLLKVGRFEPGIVLEGGSIEVNGEGVVLTTEQCLLHPRRNPDFSRQQLERILCDYLGAEQVIWLGQGIEGDHTDGHIDTLARFVNPTTVVAVVTEDRSDPNHAVLRDNLRRLRSARLADGSSLEVVELPLPDPVYDGELRLTASYANFVLANGKVIVPVFDRAQDELALRRLGRCFSDRQVVPLFSVPIVGGGGVLHCVTQQQPWSSGPENQLPA